MWVNETNYRLTKHGRQRYIERVDSKATDREMIQDCVTGKSNFTPVWKPDEFGGFRLVTVLPTNNSK